MLHFYVAELIFSYENAIAEEEMNKFSDNSLCSVLILPGQFPHSIVKSIFLLNTINTKTV